MKYFLIAGEASGDLHGSNLIKQLKEVDADAHFRCFGGELMEATGAEIALHNRKMAFIGIWEVVKNIKTINRHLEFCKQEVLAYRPDALILIDYPGFNLKIAEFAKANGIKTLYYIAPKVWASRKWRIKRMRRSIDKLYVILPFEEKYFTERQCPAEFIGNPLTDAIAAYEPIEEALFRKENNLSNKPIIALLSGSRKMEIDQCLPQMVEASKQFPDYEFVVAGAPSINPVRYEKLLMNSGIRLVNNKTYQLLSIAKAAVVVSGTATLETALFKVPEVVIYKVSTPTYIIGRPFFVLRFFSLVNIIMDRQVVKEFLQFNLAQNIADELNAILSNNSYRNEILKSYDELASLIGGPGSSARAARSIFEYLRQ